MNTVLFLFIIARTPRRSRIATLCESHEITIATDARFNDEDIRRRRLKRSWFFVVFIHLINFSGSFGRHKYCCYYTDQIRNHGNF
jgi:hypothetical protein